MVSPWRKFDEFIAPPRGQKVYSFASPYILWLQTLLKTKNIRLNDPTTGMNHRTSLGFIL
jgi:hypothetical protein